MLGLVLSMCCIAVSAMSLCNFQTW